MSEREVKVHSFVCRVFVMNYRTEGEKEMREDFGRVNLGLSSLKTMICSVSFIGKIGSK